MIPCTLGELRRAATVLEALTTQKLLGCAPVVTHLARLTKLVRQEVAYFHEQEQQFIRELGEERDPTPAEQAQGAMKMISVTEANKGEFQQRMDALEALPLVIPWTPLSVTALNVFQISASDVLTLGPLTPDPADPAP